MRRSHANLGTRNEGHDAGSSRRPGCAFDEPADGLVLYAFLVVVLVGAVGRFDGIPAYAVLALLLAASASAVLAARSLALVLTTDRASGRTAAKRSPDRPRARKIPGLGAHRFGPEGPAAA